MAAPLPKVAVLSEDGQIVGVEDEAEDEAVLAERQMIEGTVRVYIPLGACILSSPRRSRCNNLNVYCVTLHLRSGDWA